MKTDNLLCKQYYYIVIHVPYPTRPIVTEYTCDYSESVGQFTYSVLSSS